MSGGKILLFGGTVEGRRISDFLRVRRSAHTLCVATEYGEEVLTPGEYLRIHQGRMTREEMYSLIVRGQFAVVVDATHPYAVEVSANIRAACDRAGVPCLRYLRPSGSQDGEGMQAFSADSAFADAAGRGSCIFVGSAREAADYLEEQTGRIFLTTGSKELHVFTERLTDRSRLSVRVLPSAEVIASCRALGLDGKQIFAMQGPFSCELNEAMLRQAQASFLVTKDTGKSGGFPEKLEAAGRLGVRVIVIRRPEENGYGWEELLAHLEPYIEASRESEIPGDSCGLTQERRTAAAGDAVPDRTISCVGIGMGTFATLTQEAAEVIREADILFGAKRILDSVQKMPGALSAALVEEYRGPQIAAYLAEHPRYRRIAVLVSGDVGFYSGARGLQASFPGEKIRYCCGISSVVCFASRIPTAWQDAKLLSVHGKEIAVLNCVTRYRKLFLLAGGSGDVRNVCRELVEAGQNQVRVTIGTNLSYPEETLCSGSPEDFTECDTQGLHIMLLENPEAGHILTPGIADEAFARGKVPMTKEEVRILSIAKLQLTEDATVCDIGAGTGSVSVEIARLCTEGTVYAIERNPEGAALIRENSRRLCVSNVKIVEGTAPEALEDLPAPTHAFIGGSAGKMREIILALRGKNPAVRIVINTVSLESLAEVTALLKEFEEKDADIVQVSAAKSRQLGRYHMMNALNPVYIVSFGGPAAARKASGEFPERAAVRRS